MRNFTVSGNFYELIKDIASLANDLRDKILEIIDTIGYVGVAFLVALENVFPPIPSEVAVANDMHQNLTEALACLNEREREVIVSRFGIGGGDSQTLEQVGAVLGVTRERIRQIQKNAIGKLHSALQLREQPVTVDDDVPFLPDRCG